MNKKKKIVNSDDNDVLNPMEDVKNNDEGKKDVINKHAGTIDELKEDKPFPDEIADPEEQGR